MLLKALLNFSRRGIQAQCQILLQTKSNGFCIRNGVCDMMILPPLEIAKQLRFAEGTVYYVGKFDKHQLELFNDYKAKVEKASKNRYK